MKKLQNVTNTDPLRENQSFIQFKGDGFVYATNSHTLVKCPVKEIAGDSIAEDLQFYVKGKDWGKSKFNTAEFFKIEGNYLIGYDKKAIKLGMIDILFADQFKQSIGNFPDCNVVIPTNELVEIKEISFNPALLYDLCECLGFNQNFKLSFRGDSKIIEVSGNNVESKGYIMPMIKF